MTVYGITRSNENRPSSDEQRKAIGGAGHTIDPFHWFELGAMKTSVSRKQWRDSLLASLQPGDELIIYDVPALGGSLGQIILFINELIEKQITIKSIKEKFCVAPGDQQSTAIILLLGTVQKKLIAEQTVISKKKIKQSGRHAGRPVGLLGKSKLDPHKNEIKKYLKKGVSKSKIARIYDCSWPALNSFIRTRGLEE